MDSFRLNIYFVARYSTKYMKDVFVALGFKGLDFNLFIVENMNAGEWGDTEETS